MENFHEELLKDLFKNKNDYEKKRSKDRLNIFYALHKEHDEVNLHSRFITYLLDRNTGHEKEDFFAKKFFQIVLDFDVNDSFFQNYIVFPNELDKREFKNIDILLVNKDLDQAIIVENKIFADDSNYNDKIEGYNGQLERYYNTMIKGEPNDQYENIVDEQYIPHDLICKNVSVFYLCLKKPERNSFKKSKGNIPNENGVTTILYNDKIISWLKNCLESPEIKNDNFLLKIVNQYKILVENMVNQNEERIELKKIIGENENWKSTKYLIDNFNHIKWHTVYDFWNKLKGKLEQEKDQKVNLYPEKFNETIGYVTHDKKDINHGITFKTQEGELIYISSFAGNLTWGILQNDNKEWSYFGHDTLNQIDFSSFSTENTFRLINEKHLESAVNQIIKEIN